MAFRRFWVEEPSHSENVSAEKSHLLSKHELRMTLGGVQDFGEMLRSSNGYQMKSGVSHTRHKTQAQSSINVATRPTAAELSYPCTANWRRNVLRIPFNGLTYPVRTETSNEIQVAHFKVPRHELKPTYNGFRRGGTTQ